MGDLNQNRKYLSKISEERLPSQRLKFKLLVCGFLLLIGVVAGYYIWCSHLTWPFYLSRVCKYVFPSLTPIVAAIALISGFKTIEQKKESDDRTEYYKQLQWAIDNSLTNNALMRLQSPSLIRSVLTSRKIAEEEKEIAQAAEDYANALEAQLRKESSRSGNLAPREDLDGVDSEQRGGGTNTTARSRERVAPYFIGLACIFVVLIQMLVLHYNNEDEGKEKRK